MTNDFNKTDFIKTSPAPRCTSCSARTVSQPLKPDLWKCNNCNHLVDEDGVCTSTRRCESCQGRPKCTKCGKITESHLSEELDTQFRCENCNHRVSDEGDCEENSCSTCNPYSCNNCGSTLYGELDSDDEIHCDDCDHYVDSDGDCTSSSCSTCNPYSCNNCGSTLYGELDSDDEIHCDDCDHYVDSDGDCTSSSCSTCNPYSCNNCGSTLYGELDSDDEIHCDDCDHYVDSDGDCTSSSCSTCNPYSCNNCGSTLYGELDSDDEIHCDDCDHYVDSDGDCTSRNRGHCDTCDTYPDCPACGAGTYHEPSDEENNSGNYYCEGSCEHTLDYDGDCTDEPCSDCEKSCTSCSAKAICNNGPSCSYEREGNCNFCHCHDDYLPDCPDCGDNGDVEGPDDDGDFYCTYSDCNSDNYFS